MEYNWFAAQYCSFPTKSIWCPWWLGGWEYGSWPSFPMNCLSWNIRGLTDSCCKYVVCETRQQCTNLDVLFLQEVKITTFQLQMVCKSIWPDNLAFCSNHEAGCGGLISPFAPKWWPLLIDHSIDPTNCAIWVLFNVDGHPFGLINIYISNDAAERADLWRWIANSIPDAYWVISGDFNMVESPNDKCGHLSMRWTPREREAWYFMRNKFGFFDPNASRFPTSEALVQSTRRDKLHT